MGVQSVLYIGNLDARRDWGHAKDYIEAQWLILQQEKPDDYVIATGIQYSVREFIEAAFAEFDITLMWEGSGENEVGRIDVFPAKFNGTMKKGQAVVFVDSKYFRPTEVETLLGDASKAEKAFGWKPKYTFSQLVSEMVQADYEHTCTEIKK